jgi:hypothetical protein
MVGEVQGWHRRHAIQLAAQLPESPGDAVIVLDLTRELLDGFLRGKEPQPVERSAVLAFSAAASRSL